MKCEWLFFYACFLGSLLGVTMLGDGTSVLAKPYRKVVVVPSLQTNQAVPGLNLLEPMDMALVGNGDILFIERSGTVKAWQAAARTVRVAGVLPVFSQFEEGLLGITLDPHFASNHWVYLSHSLPETVTNALAERSGRLRVSRFTLRDYRLDPQSERTIVEVETQRNRCCHTAGSLAFDRDGNLLLGMGDNTEPFNSDGYSPSDERPKRQLYDAQRTSANTLALTGKILRVHPKSEGGYDIPLGNLFPPGTPGTRPEIYVMGARNPIRLAVDSRTGFLYWSDLGPDAFIAATTRGPEGYDEINQTRQAGFFGWPYFIGNNRAYTRVNFTNRQPISVWEPSAPVNRSPNNTGLELLPPAQPAMIWYAHAYQKEFPALNGGGGPTAIVGPVYYFDDRLVSPGKFPKEFDRCLFVCDWGRQWIVAVRLDANNQIAKNPDGSHQIRKVFGGMKILRPFKLEFGSDGCLYILEYGTFWGRNMDASISRIEFGNAASTKPEPQ